MSGGLTESEKIELSPLRYEDYLWVTVIPDRSPRIKGSSLGNARNALAYRYNGTAALYHIEDGDWVRIWWGRTNRNTSQKKPWNDALREKGYIK